MDDASIPLFRTKALIDTGAPLSIFPRGAADALGIELPSSFATTLSVDMVGKNWPAHSRAVTLELAEFRGYPWMAEVAFLLEEWPMNYGILGHRGFLDRWAVTFNAYKNYFIVESPTDFEHRLPVDMAREFQSRFDGEWSPPGT